MTRRTLPPEQPRWTREADVVVVGAGAAGLTTAVTAASGGRRVLLICKGPLRHGGSTAAAQGGMAAVLGQAGDSFALHAADTHAAGAGLCDPDAVSWLVSAAPGVVWWLTTLGARLADGHLEGGHSRRRIVHAASGGDAIGAEVHRVLSDAIRASTVDVLEHAVALDLAPGGLLAGLAGRAGTLLPGLIKANAVVLATGGFGQAYATTTNPAGATGDGLALAARAGAALRDLEFVQFHPTVLWSAGAGGQCPLITEAVRGAGAVVVDDSGEPVCDPLAPRDVVASAMHTTMTSRGVPHLWLDARPVTSFAARFPAVTAMVRARGIDPARDLIPVAPAAHYACGGIATDPDGRTSLPGLFAVGEVACTGVHGANRLASNSLTEAIAMGRRCGELLARGAPSGVPGGIPCPVAPVTRDPLPDPAARPALAAAMSAYAGVERTDAGLTELLRLLASAPRTPQPLDLATLESANLHTVSTLVATAALARRESRGCHRRGDVMATPA